MTDPQRAVISALIASLESDVMPSEPQLKAVYTALTLLLIVRDPDWNWAISAIDMLESSGLKVDPPGFEALAEMLASKRLEYRK